MKKLFLGMAALVAMVATSCVQTEELAVANNKEAIAFDTFVENVTKTLYDNNNLDHFNVYGTITADNGGLITNIFPGVEVSNPTGVWAYGSQFTQYWIPGFTYDFTAIVDGGVAVDANGMPKTISVDMTEQKDVLYAQVPSVEFDEGDQADVVSFQFAHLLSKAKFTVKNTISANPKLVYNIESVKITNAYDTAEYNVATGVWTGAGDYDADFEVNKAIAKGANTVSKDILLVPGTKELAIAIKYTLTYNKAADNVATLIDETKNLTAVLTLEQGKAYNFVVEFGNPGEDIKFDAVVDGWGNDNAYEVKNATVSNAVELLDALEDPTVGAVVLSEDITLSESLTFGAPTSRATSVAGRNIVIDGNNKTIKMTKYGTGRVIDVTSETNGASLILKNLTIENNVSWIERIINYNTNGHLTLEGVKIVNANGCRCNYAVNLPGSSDNAVVTIKDSEIWAGAITLNIWGANTLANIIDSKLYVVDSNADEGYSVVSLNNEGENAAHNSTVNVEGGEVKVIYEGEGETNPSSAFRDATVGSTINISGTDVVGEIKIPVVNVVYEGYDQFYSFTTVQAAIDKVQADKNGTIRLIKDLVLTEPIEVKACDYNVVLDLNGHTLSAEENATGNYGLITNKGNLTVVGNGKLQLSATHDRDWNAYSSVISNQPGGNLVVESGVVIEHLGGTDMAYGIDNLTNGKGTSAIVTVKDATVKSTYRPIRQFLNGVEATNELYVLAGAYIESTGGNKAAIWMQDPSANANTGKLVVEAGAHIQNNVYLDVTAGSTEWPVEVSVNASSLENGATVISENVPPQYQVVEKNGVWTVAPTPVVVESAVEFIAAVNNIVDGGTVIVGESFDFTKEEGGRTNNGGWWDGLGYSGDKSFTIDLNGKTVGNAKDALNDYLFWFKNDGEKPNTITIKNGTLDAGTTAYCALATASSNKQTITINLENVNLINNNTSGAVAKIRAGAVLNVKAGTKITGKNSYTGIECVGSTTNIYEGAEIYQKGTSSNWGFLAGASWGGVINVYGGKGVSARGGFMAMTSGGTVNVHGGEWTANVDGTIGNNSNLYVLSAQNNKYESGWCAPSIINVAGGTLRGGMDAWVLNDPTKEKAELNISGGNFNANPTSYLKDATATENNGIWTVTK